MLLELVGITAGYGDEMVLKDFYLSVREGELVTLLGPSGCGKSTTLRVIAGFIKPVEGIVRIGGKVFNDVPPHRRNMGMVFQSYALFPHMNVFENVAFGLRMRKLQKDEIEKRVSEALELVGLKGYETRLPSQLSGGQQQRVAIARAIVIRPLLLLMDEPLSNLDAKLRMEMRGEIKALQEKLGITTVYVTHDQAEALAISDRIAVMKDGKIHQMGTPEEIYKNPADVFVAEFVGFQRVMVGNAIDMGIESEGVIVPLRTDLKGRKVVLMARRSKMRFSKSGIPAMVKTRIFQGDSTLYRVVSFQGMEFEVEEDARWNAGDQVKIEVLEGVVFEEG